ncbi:hypothetical protein HMPREF1548_03212 [Clostridium sp. KLE 1755]|nr:hypothetical protein HMPREF1548_03212 [Clostridium sp. KLE 1755]
MGKYMTRIQGSQESSNCEGTGQFQEILKTVPENIKNSFGFYHGTRYNRKVKTLLFS